MEPGHTLLDRAEGRQTCRMHRLVAALLRLCIAGLVLMPGVCRANQVTNPFFTGTTTAATSWTSSAAGIGAAFNHALSAGAPTALSSAGSTEFYTGCVGAQCLTNPFTSGTSSGAQQTVPTTIGQAYTISFWTYFSTANNNTVEIDVYWGTTKIYAGTNVATSGWSQHTINLGAAAASSNTLTVMIRDDPSYSAITDVDIEPTGPNIGVTKVSSVISDPVNGTTNAKAIPGATVQYCVLISNTGVSAASTVVATDAIPASLTYVAGSIKTGAACASAATGGATITGSTITDNVGTLAAGASAALTYLATIN